MSETKPDSVAVDFNETDAVSPPEGCVHSIIERQAEQLPDHVAARAGNDSLTYRELDRRANQLAHALGERGLGRGSRVGILLRHSVDTVVAIVGVLKAGAAYVPLDPDYPATRLQRCLQNAGVRLVLTTLDLAPLAGDEPAVLCFDGDAALLARSPEDRPVVRVMPEEPAYVIYTSGSTGAPKGIVIPHCALVNYVLWANAAYLDGVPPNFALHSSLTFDLTVTSIFAPLTTGGVVVAYPSRGGEPPILDVLREDFVDIIKLTPSHLALVAEQGMAPSRLRTFIVGGENLHTALARRIHDQFGGRVAIFNEYGPTEATVGCMIHRYDPQRDHRASVPIGRPAANTRILVLDEHLQPVAPNIVGELYIGGAGLASGYLGEPALTAERFISDPFRPGERLYRSGDLAQHLPEGVIEFLGRDDDQIKVRGHRIHLTEIRHVLAEHPKVRDSTVRRLQDSDGRSVVVAYYVSDSEIDARELRAFTHERLGQAAVPSAFVFLRQLPLTLNGKVDIDALPGLDAIRQQSPFAGEQPRTAVEQKLTEIWCRLLRFKRLGIRESFFDLGGDSLMAVQLFLEIETTFGVQIPASVLFSDGTIEGLAYAIEKWQTAQSRSPLVRIRPRGNYPPLFLVHGIGGEVLSFEPLVRHIDPVIPIYGLQGEGVNFHKGSSLRIESMASRYLAAMREVQPEGPYFLAGYSAGGVIAFEIAQQIRAAGGEVALLAIVDGDAPPSVREKARWTPRTLVRFAKNIVWLTIDDFLVSNATENWARAQSHSRVIWSHVVGSTLGRSNGHHMPDIRDTAGVPELLEQHIPWLEAIVDAIGQYRPAYYAGQITLFRARAAGLFGQVDPDRGWTALTDDLAIRTIKGNHMTIVREPLVRGLAEDLEGLLKNRFSAHWAAAL